MYPEGMQQTRQYAGMAGAPNNYADKPVGIGVESSAPRVPELTEQLCKVEKALCYAEESLNELASRLGGVLRPLPPEPAPSTGGQLVAVGPSTHYGKQAHDLYHRAGNLGERLQDLLRRLEA